MFSHCPVALSRVFGFARLLSSLPAGARLRPVLVGGIVGEGWGQGKKKSGRSATGRPSPTAVLYLLRRASQIGLSCCSKALIINILRLFSWQFAHPRLLFRGR
jgi:hypothetical protein